MYCMVGGLQEEGVGNVFLGVAVPARGRGWELLHWRRPLGTLWGSMRARGIAICSCDRAVST